MRNATENKQLSTSLLRTQTSHRLKGYSSQTATNRSSPFASQPVHHVSSELGKAKLSVTVKTIERQLQNAKISIGVKINTFYKGCDRVKTVKYLQRTQSYFISEERQSEIIACIAYRAHKAPLQSTTQQFGK